MHSFYNRTEQIIKYISKLVTSINHTYRSDFLEINIVYNNIERDDTLICIK